jgi:membrane protease YdiL (CAAX protease family)
MRDNPNSAICLYLALTFLLSAVLWGLVIWSGHLYMGFGLMVPALMWCPALATLVTCHILGRQLRSLAWGWPKNRYVAMAYFVPLAYASIAYGTVWACRLAGWNSEFVSLVTREFGLRGMPSWASLSLYIVSMATGGLILNLSTALGEEIGWRGFLVPELARHMSFTRVGLLSGVVWTAWHVPLLMFADYNAGTNRWYALGCSTVVLVGLSFILAWLRLKSGSLWPAAFLHASHNLFVPCIFDNLIRNTGSTLWYTTQFGAALAVASVSFALYFWTRRDEVEPLNEKGLHELSHIDESLPLVSPVDGDLSTATIQAGC